MSSGVKHDTEKNRWDLLPMAEVEEVVEILTFGAQKYDDDNWMYVPDSRRRYFAAGMRHFVAWWNGEILDTESGKSHLAHAICCLLFLMWFDNSKVER